MNDDDAIEIEVTLPADEAAAVVREAARRGETSEDLIRDSIRERLLEVDCADSPRTSRE